MTLFPPSKTNTIFPSLCYLATETTEKIENFLKTISLCPLWLILKFEKASCYYFMLNLACAFKYAFYPSIAPEPLDGVFFRVSITSENLHCLSCDILNHLSGEDLCHSCFKVASFASILHTTSIIDKLPSCL